MKVKLQILGECVGECNVHCEPESYKFELLGKLVVQHGIIVLFGGMSCVWTSSLYIYFINLLSSHVRKRGYT